MDVRIDVQQAYNIHRASVASRSNNDESDRPRRLVSGMRHCNVIAKTGGQTVIRLVTVVADDTLKPATLSRSCT